MKYLHNGFSSNVRGPIVMPNASKEDKERLTQKGVKVAEVDDATAERIKRDIGDR